MKQKNVNIELIAPAGDDSAEVSQVATRISDLWMMNVELDGAMVTVKRVKLVNPKTRELVECLQVETPFGVQTVIPPEHQADFSKKRRAGSGRKKADAPKTVKEIVQDVVAADRKDRRGSALHNSLSAAVGADSQAPATPPNGSGRNFFGRN